MNGRRILGNLSCNPMISAVLFVVGAVFSLMLDIVGVMPFSEKSVLNSPLDFSQHTIWLLPMMYIILGAIVGLISRTPGRASIYGACIGQCQTILPLIFYYFIFRDGDVLGIWLRALCGLPLTLSFAGVAFSVKTLVKSRK